jgi:hypothetical protein
VAFTVNDFQDFMAVLRANPEWQAELRRVLLDDELTALRQAVLEQQRRTDERFDALTSEVRELVGVARTQADQIGRLKGMMKEIWYRDRAAAIFGRLFHSVRHVAFADIAAVRAAHRDGTISPAEWDDLALLDLLVRAEDDADRERFVAMEVSFRPDESDVSRAARRAAVLRRAGVDCLAAVGGEEVAPEVDLAARAAGTALFQDGALLFWPESGAA